MPTFDTESRILASPHAGRRLQRDEQHRGAAGAAGAARRMRRVHAARRRQDVRPRVLVVQRGTRSTSHVKQVFTWPEAAGTTSDIVRSRRDQRAPRRRPPHAHLQVRAGRQRRVCLADRERQHGVHRADHGVAVGGKLFCTPPGIAFKLTPDDACTTDCPWILLEIHYDTSNAEGTAIAGMRITYALDEAGAAATVQTCADAKDAGLCTHANAEVASQASQLCAKSCTGAGSDGTLSAQVQAAATQYASAEWTASRGRPHRCRPCLRAPRCRRCRCRRAATRTRSSLTVPALGSAMSAMRNLGLCVHQPHASDRQAIWLTAKDEEQEASEVECSTAYDFDLQEAVYLPQPVEFSPPTAFELNPGPPTRRRAASTLGSATVQRRDVHRRAPTVQLTESATPDPGASRYGHARCRPRRPHAVPAHGRRPAALLVWTGGASSEAILLAHAAFMLVAWGVLVVWP